MELATEGGQLTCGSSVSMTVTVKWHDAVLPDASVAVYVTSVEAFSNLVPEGCDIVVFVTTSLSVLLVTNIWVYVLAPASMERVTEGGQNIFGSSVSTTLTLKRHELMLPDASVAVNFIEVSPIGKG